MFDEVYVRDIYLDNKEKAEKLSAEILKLVRNEHITLPEVRSLFMHVLGQIEDTPL